MESGEIDFDALYKACDAKYPLGARKCFREDVKHRIRRDETGRRLHVFEINNEKEIVKDSYSYKVDPHETALVSYIAPAHPYTTNKEGDIEIRITASDQYKSTNSLGVSHINPPDTSVSIWETVGEERKCIGHISYDTYIDISNRKKVVALLNGLYGDPKFSKEPKEVLNYYNMLVYRENDLRTLRKNPEIAIDIANSKIKRKQRKKDQKLLDEQNKKIWEEINRKKAAEGKGTEQSQKTGNFFEKIRNRLTHKH